MSRDERPRFGDGRAGYARQSDDWYVEEERAVEALIARLPFIGAVHDPACGVGTIPRVFARRGFAVSGSDLRDRGYGTSGVDYLGAPARRYDNIVSNPPYQAGLVERFILKAIAEADHKVAMLLRSAFREGAARQRLLFQPHRPHYVLDFTWRVSMPPGEKLRPDGSAVAGFQRRGGQMPFAWFVWERGWVGPHYEGGWL